MRITSSRTSPAAWYDWGSNPEVVEESGRAMATGGDQPLLRRGSGEQRTTFVELFFDLVFILALTLLSRGLVDDLSWRGAVRTLVLLLAIWWVWTNTVWTTETFDPTRPAVQRLVICVMFGSLVMSASLSDALHGQGLTFAVAYVATQLGISGYILLVLRRAGQRRLAVRGLLWYGVSAVPWLAGGFADGTARWVWWAAAVAVDYGAGALRWPVPGLGRLPASEFYLTGGHLSERYRQILILALGEMVLVSGTTFSDAEIHRDQFAALMMSFAITVLMWRIYIHRAGELLPVGIRTASEPYRSGQAASPIHLVMVAGIVVTAVGAELVIGHPESSTPLAWVIVLIGGPALFLIGRAVLGRLVFRRLPWFYLVALAALAALAPAGPVVSPLLLAFGVAVILLAVAIANQLSWPPGDRVPEAGA